MAENSFDQAYFQTGSERGTRYANYLEGAPKNRFYYEVAQAAQEIFRPARSLEIGCAAGIVVSHMASFDIDAHGIDVSEWAVNNRFDSNVVLASAADLPYEDNSFDLVYSIHALEHLPRDVVQPALREMARVCRGPQVHLMPMLETGPYVGDRFGHLLNLRTDPTHSLLFDKGWWRERFQEVGLVDLDLQIAFAHDSEYFEFSDCQIIVAPAADPAVDRRLAQWNHRVARLLSQALNGRPTCGLDVHVARLRGAG